jgi:hypothetical protein
VAWEDPEWAKLTHEERAYYVGRTRVHPDPPRRRLRWPSVRESALLVVLVALLALVARSNGGFGGMFDRLASASASAPLVGGPTVGSPWPDGLVRYYNDAPEHEWALRQAVDAWNRSGARIRLRRTDRLQADLVVHSTPEKQCGHGRATVGYSVPATITIFSLRVDRGCDRYSAARALTHELGHVLGLDHTTAACAVMNPLGSYSGSPRCLRSHASLWRCRLLEPSDAEAAVKLYGGSPAPVRAQPLCAM